MLACSDLHSGHVVGLTHPRYQYRTTDGKGDLHSALAAVQDQCWNAFDQMLDHVGKVDAVLFGGDSIDGKGARSGGTETIKGSMEDQANMAVAVFDHMRLKVFKRKTKLIGVHGTPYHEANNGEDWGNIVAEHAEFDAFSAQEFVDVDGCIFDIKHKVGGGSLPHTRGNAIKKSDLWNAAWAEDGVQPRANVILRGHVHHYSHADSLRNNKPTHMATMPALQAAGSKYGARQCDGTVHFGVILIEITDGIVSHWGPLTASINAQKVEAYVV